MQSILLVVATTLIPSAAERKCDGTWWDITGGCTPSVPSSVGSNASMAAGFTIVNSTDSFKDKNGTQNENHRNGNTASTLSSQQAAAVVAVCVLGAAMLTFVIVLCCGKRNNRNQFMSFSMSASSHQLHRDQSVSHSAIDLPLSSYGAENADFHEFVQAAAPKETVHASEMAEG